MSIDRKAGAALVAAAFLSMVCLWSLPALGGFTASANNTANAIGSGTSFLTASDGGGTQCSSATGGPVTGTAAFSCTRNQFPATVPTTGASGAAETLSATGTTPFTSASYDPLSCGPVQLDNTRTASNPMLVRGGVSFAQAGTGLAGSASIGLDGATDFATDVTLTTGLQNFSIGVWFKTSVATGGLMGFSSSPSGAVAASGDRVLYLSAGRIIFGVQPGASPGTQRIIPSPLATYADGAWHHAVATLTSSGTNGTQRLYVDGNATPVATATFKIPSGAGAKAYSGYWRVGQIGASVSGGWTGTASYLNGFVSGVAVFPSVLTGAQVNGFYTAGTQAALDSRIATAGATFSWPMLDTGLTTFAGPYPVLGATSPCAHVNAAVGTGGRCVYPAAASACAIPPTATLSALVSAGALALTPGSGTLTTTLSRAAGYVDYDTGLLLLVPVTIVENGFTQSFIWPANMVVI